MDLSFLKPAYTSSSPVASVYINVSRDVEDAEQAIQTRWSEAREDLESQGVNAETLQVLDQVIGRGEGNSQPGGQLTFAADGRIIFDRLVAEPSPDYSAWLGPLPDPAPYLKSRGQHVPYVLTIVHSTGAAFSAVDTAGERHKEQLEEDETQHSEQPEKHVERIVAAIERITVNTGAEAVVLGGEPQLRERVRGQLSQELAQMAIDADIGDRPAGPEGIPLDDELQHRLDERAEQQQRTAANAFERERGNTDRVVEGFAPVVYALRQGQVETLLWSEGLAGGNADLWIGPASGQLGLADKELHDMGVEEPVRENAEPALLRAAVSTSASLVFLPQHDVEPDEGIGALLHSSGVSLPE